MLGRKAVADRERAHARRASGLRHHAAVAQDRARAKAAAVEEHQHARGVGAGRDRPLPRHAAAIDRLAADVVGHGPDRADLVETRPPLSPADRAGLCREHRADGVDLLVYHVSSPLGSIVRVPLINSVKTLNLIQVLRESAGRFSLVPRSRRSAGNPRRPAALMGICGHLCPTGRYLFDPASRGVFFALHSAGGLIATSGSSASSPRPYSWDSEGNDGHHRGGDRDIGHAGEDGS